MNNKSLLAVFFAAMSCSEMTHPIIFTGPARRNAHREQEQEAYAAGMMAGAAGADMATQNSGQDDQGDEVQIQAYTGGNISYPDLMTPVTSGSLANQPFPQFKSLDRFSSLTNSYENDPLANVSIQSIDPEVQDDTAENQSATHEETHDQVIPTLLMHEEKVPEIKPEEIHVPEVVHEEPKHDQTPTLMMHEEKHEPEIIHVPEATHEEVHATAELPQIHLVQAVQASQELVDAVQPIEHKVEEVQLVSPAPQIKIVKVYPVYEAIRAAADRVYNASRDMVDYVWSFMSTKK